MLLGTRTFGFPTSIKAKKTRSGTSTFLTSKQLPFVLVVRCRQNCIVEFKSQDFSETFLQEPFLLGKKRHLKSTRSSAKS